MAITELTTIEWKTPYTWESPTVRAFIERLIPSQTASSGYPLYFFHPEGGENETVILTGWESVDAHMAWVRDVGVPLLGEYMGSLFELTGQVHVDVNFAEVSGDAKYVIWETVKDGEEGRLGRVNGALEMIPTVSGKILDEGQKGLCTLQVFKDRPEGEGANGRILVREDRTEPSTILIQCK
ncbi:hypothetical protein C8Q74DRAFT_1229503 [Fomes fomentarius]|nr:hypothetical protein C8Q74DRAFT_1229503 [Fomes fomentarius]